MSQINKVIEDIGSTNLICQNKTEPSNPINLEPSGAGLLVPYNGQLYVSHTDNNVLQWFKLGNSTGDSGGSDPSITYNRICYYADGSKFNGTLTSTSSNDYFDLNIENGNLSLTLNDNLYENVYWLFRDDSRISNDNNSGDAFLTGYILNPFYESEEPDPERPHISGNKIIVNPPIGSTIDFDINIVDQDGGHVDGTANVYECNWDWNGGGNIPHIYRGELIKSEPSYMGVRGTLSANTIRYLCIDYISSEYVEDADGHRFYYHYVSIVQLPSNNVESSSNFSNNFVITLNVEDREDWHIYEWTNQDLSETDECPWEDSADSNPWENF